MWQSSRNVLVALKKLNNELHREKVLRKQILTGIAQSFVGDGIDRKREALRNSTKYGAQLFFPTMDIEPMLSQIGVAAIDRLIEVRALDKKHRAAMIKSLKRRWKLSSNYTPLGAAVRINEAS